MKLTESQLGKNAAELMTNKLSPREAAWRAVTDELRGRGRPTKKAIAALARKKAREYARNNNIDLSLKDAEALGEKIAISICKNWKPTAVRKPPKIGRARRDARDLQIARRYQESLKAGKPLSRRVLATEFGVGANTVQRILNKFGFVDSAQDLSPPARALKAVLDYYVPVDARRAFDLAELTAAAEIAEPFGPDIVEELNETRCGYLITDTPVASGRGSRLVVVSRGRKKRTIRTDGKAVEQQPLEWLSHAEKLRFKPGRSPQRPPQWYYCFGVEPVGAGMIECDILSAVRVSYGSRNLADWRRFIEASVSLTGGSKLRLENKDRDAILTVIQSATRLDKDSLPDSLALAKDWPPDRDVRKVAGELIELAISMMSLVDSDPLQLVAALNEWMARTGYRDRIDSGDLLNRDAKRLDEILALIADLDPGQVVELLIGSDPGQSKTDETEAELATGLSQMQALLFDLPVEEHGYIYPINEDEDDDE